MTARRHLGPYILSIVAIVFLALPASSQDCEYLDWVTVAGDVDINAGHIFCGELHNGRPKGFHSLALARSASANLIAIPPTPQRIQDLGNGLYNATVVFHRGATKRSTFFPSGCSYTEILNSIRYAVLHQTGPHPVWGVLGPSAPSASTPNYCLGNDGGAFTIRMGLLDFDHPGNPAVNTAFPSP